MNLREGKKLIIEAINKTEWPLDVTALVLENMLYEINSQVNIMYEQAAKNAEAESEEMPGKKSGKKAKGDA